MEDVGLGLGCKGWSWGGSHASGRSRYEGKTRLAVVGN